MEEKDKVLNIPVLETTWEKIRKLCYDVHEHPDGMNECPICDKELIEDVLDKLNAWKPQHQLTEETEEGFKSFIYNSFKAELTKQEYIVIDILKNKILDHYKLIKREK
jgi:hypothetical protein